MCLLNFPFQIRSLFAVMITSTLLGQLTFQFTLMVFSGGQGQGSVMETQFHHGQTLSSWNFIVKLESLLIPVKESCNVYNTQKRSI